MALHERQFQLLFSAQSISWVGSQIVPVALAFAVLDLTGSAADLGFVLSARLVSMVVFLLTGGVWADRLSRRTLMIGTSLLQMVSQGMLGALLVFGHARIWELMALQFVQGTAIAFARPASRGVVAEIVPPERRRQANALLWGVASLAGAVGPALGGVLVSVMSPGLAILADAASFALAAVLFARMQLPASPPTPRASFLHDLQQGWREVSSRRWVWAGIVNSGIACLVWLSSLSVLGPLVAKQSLGGPSAWALILVAYGIGAFLGNAVVLRVRPRRPLVLAYCLTIGCSLTLFLLALAAPLPLIVVTELYSGAAGGIYGVLWETTLQEQIPLASYSRVAAYDSMGGMVLRPLGLAIMGPLAALIGVRMTLIGAGVLTATNSALLLLLVPEVRKIPSGGPALSASSADVPARPSRTATPSASSVAGTPPTPPQAPRSGGGRCRDASA